MCVVGWVGVDDMKVNEEMRRTLGEDLLVGRLDRYVSKGIYEYVRARRSHHPLWEGLDDASHFAELLRVGIPRWEDLLVVNLHKILQQSLL